MYRKDRSVVLEGDFCVIFEGMESRKIKQLKKWIVVEMLNR